MKRSEIINQFAKYCRNELVELEELKEFCEEFGENFDKVKEAFLSRVQGAAFFAEYMLGCDHSVICECFKLFIDKLNEL